MNVGIYRWFRDNKNKESKKIGKNDQKVAIFFGNLYFSRFFPIFYEFKIKN